MSNSDLRDLISYVNRLNEVISKITRDDKGSIDYKKVLSMVIGKIRELERDGSITAHHVAVLACALARLANPVILVNSSWYWPSAVSYSYYDSDRYKRLTIKVYNFNLVLSVEAVASETSSYIVADISRARCRHEQHQHHAQ